MLQVGVAALAIAVAVVIFDLAASTSLRQRVATLEAAAQRQAETLANVQIRLTADQGHEQLATLDHRLDALAVSVAALETGKAPPTNSETMTPIAKKPAQKAEQQDATAGQNPRTGTSDLKSAPADKDETAPWVINLVSLYDQAAADRFTRQARDKGIDVTQNRVQVQGRPVWRLQIDGFDTREAALVYSEANKDKLGLKKVWIFKR